MNPEIVEIDAPKMSGGAPEPEIRAGQNLRIAYRVAAGMLEEKWAIVDFSRYSKLSFGHPNEEVLHGHPLYKYGIKFYRIQEVKHSPWIEEIKKVNSVHSRHSDALFEDDRHWIFTFQDQTLEIVSDIEPEYRIVEADSASEAFSK